MNNKKAQTNKNEFHLLKGASQRDSHNINKCEAENIENVFCMDYLCKIS